MTQAWITTIGIAAAIGTTASFLPQAVKTVRTRSAKDFSWLHLVMFTTGVALWLVYGLLRHDAAVTGANAATLLLLFVIVGVKFRSRSRQ
ncbi:MAG TPA: SemiSWEET transporter [Thermoanaerobaculia bacterium]|nr:SemiSWEET transporter [Thermoanaerobaculia bacterium]